MSQVYGYMRVSGRAQVDGDGFPRQSEAIRAFCLHHQLGNPEMVLEEAVSGTVEGMDRPEFARMLNAIRESGAPAVVVVERLDRLARDLMVSEMLLAECRRYNVTVFATDQGALIDMASSGGDPTRVLIRQIMGALAQWDKSMLVKRLKASRDRIKAKTGRCGGRKLYGSTPAEARILQAIFEFRDSGMSLNRLAAFLNESGMSNKHSKGGLWNKHILSMFLKRNRQRYENAKKEKEAKEGVGLLIRPDGSMG